MEYFILWLCSIASSVHNMLIIAGIAGAMAYGITWGIRSDCQYDNPQPKKRWFVLPLMSIFFGVITPMTSDCYMIFGVGKTLEYVTNSEEVKKLPDNAVKAINYYLEGIPEHNHKNHGSHNDSIQSN